MGQEYDNQKTAGREIRKAGRSRAAKQQREQEMIQEEIPEFLGAEVAIIVSFASSVLLFISNFRLCGIIGNFFRTLQLGLFGMVGYLFPVLFFAGTCFYLSNVGNRRAAVKLFGVIGVVFTICGFCQMLFGTPLPEGESVFYLYQTSSADGSGGGLIGAVLAFGLKSVVGSVGAYVIFFVILTICGICITEKSLINAVKQGSGRAYQYARKDAARRREEHREKRKEQEEWRRQREEKKIVRGVNLKSTRIIKEPLPEEEIIIQKEMAAGRMPAEKKLPENEEWEKTSEETAVFSADVFSGKIEIPPEYQEEFSEEEFFKEKTETKDLHRQQEKKHEEAQKENPYVFPPLKLLQRGIRSLGTFSDQEYKETAIKLQQTLKNFGVGVAVTNISCGPSVTRYELHPEQGVKVSRIISLTDDIKLSLAASEIRIEAPIPGKSALGIEVPNKENSMVYLRDLLESDGFRKSKSSLTFAVGKDISGQPVMADISRMPHLLIAGATGSGKSVCINTLIMSIIFKADPEEVKLIMVDPKVVELSVYNGIPHLLIPVVTDPKKASGALNWAVGEMEERYRKFAEYHVRNLQGYNEKIKHIGDISEKELPKKMPQIVLIIDELADLMMVVPGEVEDAICRLAQLARAAGIHLVIATQRPSVNVITGLIKANIPSRIAFAVSSGIDSRTIIDMNGAEKLLGRGDMLFFPSGIPKPVRVQGAFISDQEVSDVVEYLINQGVPADYSDMESQVMSDTPSFLSEMEEESAYRRGSHRGKEKTKLTC